MLRAAADRSTRVRRRQEKLRRRWLTDAYGRKAQQLLRWATVPEQSGGGAVVPLSVGELGPNLTQCGLGRGLQPYQVASLSI